MAKKKIKQPPKKSYLSKFWRKKFIISFLAGVAFISAIVITWQLVFINRLYPGILIANSEVGVLSPEEAKFKLTQTLSERANKQLTFSYKDSDTSNNEYLINLSDQLFQPQIDQSIDQAMEYGHSKFYLPPVHLDLKVNYTSLLDQQVEKIAKQISIDPINAQIKVENGEINVTPSQNGLTVDQEELENYITQYLNNGALPSTQLPTKIVQPKLSYQTALNLKKSLDQIKLQPLQLEYNNQSWEITLEQALGMLDLSNTKPSLVSASVDGETINIASVNIGGDQYTDTSLVLDKEKIDFYLKNIATEIDQPLIEPLFEFDPNSPNRIKQFKPPQEGRQLNIEKAANLISQSLTSANPQTVKLPVSVTEPENKLSNDLGIKEWIGGGQSDFSGSIENRVFNLGLAASRINGVLIPPNQEFSFVNAVGDISAASGYKQGYIIKSGRTVLDDGGGVCQISTTVFRAALNTGLPITDRTAHAYRVGYYENDSLPGLDATIFSPSVDLKFKNDTGYHILLQARVEGRKVFVDMYGTSDGRKSLVSKPVILGTSPPLPEIRQDDPTLHRGTVKQVDWPASGANVLFTRVVTRGAETLINETFRSNYRPWQAVYLVGTKDG